MWVWVFFEVLPATRDPLVWPLCCEALSLFEAKRLKYYRFHLSSLLAKHKILHMKYNNIKSKYHSQLFIEKTIKPETTNKVIIIGGINWDFGMSIAKKS